MVERQVCMCVAFLFLNKPSENANGFGSTKTRERSVCVLHSSSWTGPRRRPTGSAQLKQEKGLYVCGITVLKQTLGEGQWVWLNYNKRRSVCAWYFCSWTIPRKRPAGAAQLKQEKCLYVCVAFQFLNRPAEKARGFGSTKTRERSLCAWYSCSWTNPRRSQWVRLN